jgi:hypothetical protein
MATPQFNRKEVVRELLGEEPSVFLLASFAEKTDREVYEIYKIFKR